MAADLPPLIARLPAIAFAFVAVPLCLFLAMVVPAGQGPDEATHLVRAASLLHGDMLGRRGTVKLPGGGTKIMAGVDADPALAFAANALPPGALTKLDLATLKAALDQRWVGVQFVPAPNTAAYLPVFYVPSAIGLAIARWRGTSPYQAIRAARLANAAAFVGFGLAALLLARRGRWLLFCALALPMTLFLASVVSQDGLLVAASALAAALVSRRSNPPPDRTRRLEYAVAACLVGCIAIAKPPYFPLAAMLLLPLAPAGAWRVQRRVLLRRLGVVALVAVPVLAWFWLTQRDVVTPLARSSAAYAPGPLWPGDPARTFNAADAAAQLTVLRAHWTRIVTLPLQALTRDPSLLPAAIGILGWLTVRLPERLYLAWEVALVAALLAGLMEPARERRAGQWPEAVLLLAATAVALLLICLSQYLSWTLVGLDRIEGVQGRYLLPLVPMVAIALPQVVGRRGAALYAVLSLPPLAVALYEVAILPMVVVNAWYLR